MYLFILSVWSEVQACIWPSWCHCHSLSLASVKSRLILPFWYWLTRVVPDKGPLNGCVCVCVCVSFHFCVVAYLFWKLRCLCFLRPCIYVILLFLLCSSCGPSEGLCFLVACPSVLSVHAYIGAYIMYMRPSMLRLSQTFICRLAISF